jgi:hypothetical protein
MDPPARSPHGPAFHLIPISADWLLLNAERTAGGGRPPLERAGSSGKTGERGYKAVGGDSGESDSVAPHRLPDACCRRPRGEPIGAGCPYGQVP